MSSSRAVPCEYDVGREPLVHSVQAAARSLSNSNRLNFDENLIVLQRLLESADLRDTARPPLDDGATPASPVSPVSDARPLQQFSLDAPAMNASIQEQYAARERQARVQIVQFMEENDTHLPALAVCSGVLYYPDTKRLAAFTGDRFFRGLAASCSGRGPVSSSEGAAMHVPETEADATESFFRIVEGEAPASLCAAQMIDLLAITKFYMADSVVALLPGYFAAGMQQMAALELALLTGELLAHLADRSDYDEASASLLTIAAASPGVATSQTSFREFATALLDQTRSAAPEPACRLHTAMAQHAALPRHFRMLSAVLLVATLGEEQPAGAAQRVLAGVHADVCAQPCEHAAALSDLYVHACTDAPTAARTALLALSHRQLLTSHCEGGSLQRLRLAPPGRAVVLGKTGDREMFVARLALPTAASRATETQQTDSGWWLKLERCPAASDGCRTTFSLFLNNARAAKGAAAVQAAFEIGIIAAGTGALRKAEAAAVLIEQVCFMRPGLWGPSEAAVHRSAIRQEFGGSAWGIRHLVDEQALARFGYNIASGEPVFIFAMVQSS